MSKTLDLVFKLDVFMNNGFTGKISTAARAFQVLQDRTQALQKASADIGAYRRQENTIGGLTTRLGTMRENLATASQRADTQREVSRELNAQYTREREKLRAMAGTMPKSSAAYKDQAAKVRELASAYKQSESAVKKLDSEQVKLAQSVIRAEDKLQGERAKLAEMSSALNSAGISTDNLSGKQRELAQAINRSEQAQAKYSALKERVSWGNIKGAIAETAPIAGVIRPMVQLAGDFEAQMQRVKAVAFSTDDADLSQFVQLKEYAAQLGAETQFTAIEAGQAMENLARAGMSAPDIIATMRPLLDMSAAEGMGISDASSILSGIQGGLGMKADDSARIADVLAYTSATSNLSIAGLGEAMKQAAPLAKTQNVKLEQLSAYIATLANKGLDMSTIGTGLRNTFLQLTNSKVQQKLSSLGVATVTKKGELVELPEIFSQLNSRLSKMGAAKQGEIIGDIFGKQNAAVVSGLMMGAQSGETAKYERGITDSAKGQSSRMANINLDSLNGQLTLLSSAWDGLKTTLGDMFLPHVREAVEMLSSAISKLTGFIKEFPNASKASVMTLTAIAAIPAAKSLFSIGSALIQLPGAFLQVVNAGRNAGSVIAGISGAVNNAGGVFSSLGGVISKTFAIVSAHPFITVAGAVISAGALIYQNWDTIREFAGTCSEWIKNKWQSFSDWFSSLSLPNIFAPIADFASTSIDYVKNLFAGLGDWIMNTIGKLNPFNWEMPSWLGGGQTQVQKQGYHDRAVNALDMAFGAPQPISAHATGGIFSTPHVALFAEKGAEAVIPLTDKSRGIPLLMQSAAAMGLQPVNNFMTQNSRIQEASTRNFESMKINGGGIQSINYDEAIIERINNNRNYTQQNSAQTLSPAINITVNSDGVNNDEGLAQKIAEAVRNALSELQSLNERVEYA